MKTLVIDDHAALQAALDSGLIPAEIQATPLRFGYDDEGRLLLATGENLSRSLHKQLREAGVAFRRRQPRDPLELGCWAEAIPTRRGSEPKPPLGEVLFVSEGDEGFLRLSGELLRLGSEEQRLGFFVDEQGRRRNLCRVPDPPYYAILRALDRDDPLRAFIPARAGGRVWLELGAEHPLAERLDAAPGQLVLIPKSGTEAGTIEPWLRVPDGPWVDLDAVSDVQLPEATRWQASQPSARLRVTLGLVRAPHRQPADLWVVRERALEQLEGLVRTIPDGLIARLRFAAVEVEDELRGGTRTIIVLRARRSALGPPALELDAEAYVPVPQIPDLYIPTATVIDPPLRPSRLRELLAEDNHVVWLASGEPRGRRGTSFVRESLHESAFAPLADWIDYLIGSRHELVDPWVRSTAFAFDAFVSVGVEWEDGTPAKPKPKPKPEHRQGRERARPSFELEELPDLPDPLDEPAVELPTVLPELEPIDLPRSEAEQHVAALEAAFCELDTALDHPERTAMWAEIANLQASLYRSREAGLCWARALWEPLDEAEAAHSGRPRQLALARRWVESECVMLGYPDGGHMLGIVDVLEADLDEQMVRGLAAEVVYAELYRRASEPEQAGCQDSLAKPPPELGAEQLASLQRFFVNHGPLLDLRTLWLARTALARLAGDDRLAMFQTRDMIMASLRDGIGLARNIPTFIRTYGNEGDAGDLNRLANELATLRDVYLETERTRSTIESTFSIELTHAYVRLGIAWGLARLGRSGRAREEQAAAMQLLGGRIAEPDGDPIHRAAFLAYQARIEQALEGLPPGAPLSAAPGGPIDAREQLAGISRFKYDRLVSISRILDPRQDVDAFERWNQKDEQPFAGLALLGQPEQLAALFDRMLAQLPTLGPEPRAKSLLNLLEYLEALPEGLALPRLQAALPVIPSLPLELRPRVLRNALLLTGVYDRHELIASVLALLEQAHAELSEQQPAAYAELLSRTAPLLRRTNNEGRLSALLAGLEARTADEHTLEGALARLRLAGAYASLGQADRIQAAFESALGLLAEISGQPQACQGLLSEMAIALSRSNPGQAIAGARSLLERLATTTDSMSTNSHYCLSVVHLMEVVVLSLASEDLALSDWARRWIEEDEQLLHRRVHQDLAGA